MSYSLYELVIKLERAIRRLGEQLITRNLEMIVELALPGPNYVLQHI